MQLRNGWKPSVSLSGLPLGLLASAVAVGAALGLAVRGPEAGTWMFALVVFTAASVGVLQQALP